MTAPARDPQPGDGPRWPGDLRLAAFLVIAALWLRYRVDPSLTYFGAGITSLPSFSPDPLFLRGHLARPGGPVQYLAAWVSQWLYEPWFGALLLTLVAGATAVALDRVITMVAGRRLSGLRYAPAVVCLILDGRY